jgi:hypothetical protein
VKDRKGFAGKRDFEERFETSTYMKVAALGFMSINKESLLPTLRELGLSSMVSSWDMTRGSEDLVFLPGIPGSLVFTFFRAPNSDVTVLKHRQSWILKDCKNDLQPGGIFTFASFSLHCELFAEACTDFDRQ